MLWLAIVKAVLALAWTTTFSKPFNPPELEAKLKLKSYSSGLRRLQRRNCRLGLAACDAWQYGFNDSP